MATNGYLGEGAKIDYTANVSGGMRNPRDRHDPNNFLTFENIDSILLIIKEKGKIFPRQSF